MPEPAQIPPPGIPPSELEITSELVARLLAEQHPDLAGHDLRLFGSGWDNTTFRLGEDLAVRMPRRKLGAQMMVKEHRWLSELDHDLPLPIGAPVRLGSPGAGYPWSWSVVPWYEGVSAEVEGVNSSQAAIVGEFLQALHVPGPDDAPRNGWRGIPLADRADSVEQRLARLGEVSMNVSWERVSEVWFRVRDIPIDTSDVWLHGDLHARNIIVRDGSLVAIIDWGDLCVGDPANDLAASWMLFPLDAHEQLRAAYGPITEATWERARGWAIFFGVVMVDAGLSDDPAWAEAGMRALERACG